MTVIQSVNGSMEPDDVPPVLASWLLVVSALVFAMVVVGGITRLTGSGLSITEWKPVTGVVPPLSEAAWLGEFGKYHQSPQFQQVTGPAGMTLADFKFIYFWEWMHRLLGRLIGLAYALPLAWFWLRKMIPAVFKVRLLILLVLGAMQGVAGWWMVASGLVDRPEVSHYRLALHLLLAVAILGSLVWVALDLRLLALRAVEKSRLTGFGALVLAVLFVELLLGAFMAGLKAGQVAPTWPLIHGHLVPPGIDWSWDLLLNMDRHTVLVHFLHRWWAWVVVAVLIVLARKVRRVRRAASVALHSAFGTQIVLGIATVVTGVDVTLAVLHQACGALVTVSTVWCLHILGQGISCSPHPARNRQG